MCVGVCVFAFGVAGMFTSQILGLSECGRAYIPVFRFVKVLVWFCVCVHALYRDGGHILWCHPTESRCAYNND